jgi:[acyl-carrier-protein] S-malonyltransferase
LVTGEFPWPLRSKHFTIITYDLRGHGNSPVTNKNFTLDDLVLDLEKIREKTKIDKAHFAGHSLGEYSALVSAGAIKLSDAAKILRLRGEAMQNAVPLNIGAMAALIGVDIDIIDKIRSNYVDTDEVLDIGNDNAPGQMVISGHNSAVEKVINNHNALGIKRVIKLPVSAPFHCRLMKKAADNMEAYIADLEILCPKIILINNVDAAPITDPIKIKESLIRQITETVRWRESIQNMCELGSSYFVELGAGNVLSGLVKRINKNVESISIQNIDDIENFVNNLER